MGDWARADEGQVRDSRVRGQVVGGVGPAGYGGCEVWGVVVCDEGAADDVDEVFAAPGCLFAVFD